MPSQKPTFTTTVSRLVGARLVVRCDNGDEWDLTTEDLATFDLVVGAEVYERYWRFLNATVTPHVAEAQRVAEAPRSDLLDALDTLVSVSLNAPTHHPRRALQGLVDAQRAALGLGPDPRAQYCDDCYPVDHDTCGSEAAYCPCCAQTLNSLARNEAGV